MTTLPQTTPMRLPRPAGPAPLMIAGPLNQQTGAQFQMSGADVWRVIRANRLIIAALILSTAGGFGLNWFLAKYFSRYTAAGYIQIQQSNKFYLDPRIAQQGTDLGQISLDQRTQTALLKNESLFIRVLQNPNGDIRKTSWFKGFRSDVFRAKEDLLDYFRVDVVPESRLVSVKMSYRDPRACRTIVEEIVNQHLEDQKQIAQNKTLERSVILNNLKQRYQFKKDELARDLREKSLRLSIDGMGAPGRLSAKEEELKSLLSTQFEMQRNAAEATQALKSIVDQLNEGQDPSIVAKEMAQDPDVQQAKSILNQLDFKLGDMTTLGPQHKEVIKLKAMRDQQQQKLENAMAAVRAKTTAAIVEALRSNAAATETQLKAIAEKVDTAKADLGDLTNAMNQYLTIKEDEQTTREMLKTVTDQIDQINQQSNSDTSTVAWATRPETPDTPSFPKLPWVLSISIVVGLALALGIAFLREVLDTTVRSPRDIARVGQLNLLGMIPHEDDDPQAAGAPLPMVIFQAPHSMLAEQYRQVRSRLQHVASLDSTRSLMVTSPSPADGKSTVACNLAAGLALNGRRILLVDANFRRPELHKIYGLPNDAGFSAVLNSIDNFANAVCQTQVPNLDVLPSGPRPSNATELLESQLLIDFIERALEEYDHVIFDSGPLLFVSESVALAPRVDGVISVVKARANTRGLLQRMRDNLRNSKAEHLGVILNGVRAQAGGYYNRNMKTYYAYQNGHGG
jgi:polysaccharide biosynthesis transport protein